MGAEKWNQRVVKQRVDELVSFMALHKGRFPSKYSNLHSQVKLYEFFRNIRVRYRKRTLPHDVRSLLESIPLLEKYMKKKPNKPVTESEFIDFIALHGVNFSRPVDERMYQFINTMQKRL